MGYLSGGQIVARMLKREGVTHIFTLCGGHVWSIYDGCLDEGIRVVDFRHEQSAAHAADGWARATGKPGVAVVTAGPGVTDAVTGVANAWRAGVPLLVIGGQGPRIFSEMGSLQEMNHVELMRPITKWAASVPEARRIADYIAIALRKATTGVPGPVFLEMPLDLLSEMVDEGEVTFPENYRTEAATFGDPQYVERAARLLLEAERPVALVGSQLWWSARREVLPTFMERFALPTCVNGMARGALTPGNPYYFVRARKTALKDADVVIVFGTPFDFRLGYGQPPKIAAEAKVIQVDLDPAEVGRNRAVDAGIVGDTGAVMTQLIEAAGSDHPRARDAWVEKLRAKEEAELEKIRPQLISDEVPINPLRLCADLNTFVDEKTIVIGDGGDIVGTGANIITVHRQGQWMDPGPLGTLGVGPGYAIAAKLARPDHKVVILYGDGSFGLNAMEFEAAIRQKIPIVGVIGNDAAWMQIRRGQIAFYGEERAVATALSYTRYDEVVAAMGGHGEYVERPEEIKPAIARALEAGKPALVNVKIGTSSFRANSISV